MTETVVNVQEAPNNNSAKPPASTHPLSWIKINLDYFRTTPGLLKIGELVCFKKKKTTTGKYSNYTTTRRAPYYVIN